MRSPVKTILLSGFTAGTLDILAAVVVYSVVMQKTTAVKILQSIAGGVFKAKAYAGGTAMALYGLIFHFCIAFCFAAGYFFVFPHIPFLRKHKMISGVLYGIFVWAVMNLLVLPLVFTQTPPITLESFLLSVSILILMVGLPVSLITHTYYTSAPGTAPGIQ